MPDGMPDGSGILGFTDDRLLGGRVRLRQALGGFRAAIDPVLLAAALRPRPGERLLELGTGNGAAALCLLARCPEAVVEGWEIDAATADLARTNAALNGAALAVRTVDALAEPAGAPFDQAFSNPPYHDGQGTDPSPAADRRRAMLDQGTGEWMTAAARQLRHKGRLTLIWRADRLPALLAALAPRFGAIDVLPLWPKAGQPAKRVLVRAVKGSRRPFALGPGLVLHTEEGPYTAAARAILADAQPLEFPS